MQTLIGAGRVRPVSRNGVRTYACMGREDAENVLSRPAMSLKVAEDMVSELDKRVAGKAVTMPVLEKFDSVRLFGFR